MTTENESFDLARNYGEALRKSRALADIAGQLMKEGKPYGLAFAEWEKAEIATREAYVKAFPEMVNKCNWKPSFESLK